MLSCYNVSVTVGAVTYLHYRVGPRHKFRDLYSGLGQTLASLLQVIDKENPLPIKAGGYSVSLPRSKDTKTPCA